VNAAGPGALPAHAADASPARFTLAATGGDPDSARIAGFLLDGQRDVERFFGEVFPKPFLVRSFPSRAAMDEHWRKAWNAPDLTTECWMVASGVASELDLLAPRAWKTDACEHDPADLRYIRLLLTHELVHVFHGQNSPRPDFDGWTRSAGSLRLAVYASASSTALRRGRAEGARRGKAEGPGIGLERTVPVRPRGFPGRLRRAQYGRRTIRKMLGDDRGRAARHPRNDRA
jgi:hypothetical protein